MQTTSYALFSLDQKQDARRYLNKLHMYNITTLNQIQNLDTQQILSLHKFKKKSKLPQK